MATIKAPPSVFLSDAISAFSKSVNNAFALADNEARVDIARANAETREALRERDEARKLLHDTQLEEKSWKQEVGAWKAAAEKVEITNQHYTETITQLRQEARQWKDQCLRLEETSRDWKEQFVRVEQERVNLLSRIDELVAERMMYPVIQPMNSNAFTPNARYTELQDFSGASTSTKRASSSSNPFQSNGHKSMAPLSASDQDSPSEYQNGAHRSKSSRLRPQEAELNTSPKQARAQIQQAPVSKTLRHDPSSTRTLHHPASPTRIARQEPTRSEPRQQIIRRVTATINAHVKEEDLDDEEELVSASASARASSSAEVETNTANNVRTTSRNRIRRSRRSAPENDDDSYEEDDGAKDTAVPGSESESDDEDDELNIMSQMTDVGKDVHATSTRRATGTPRRSKAAKASKPSGSSGKKRKVGSGRPPGGSAAKARRL